MESKSGEANKYWFVVLTPISILCGKKPIDLNLNFRFEFFFLLKLKGNEPNYTENTSA